MSNTKEHPSLQGPGTGGASAGPVEGFHSLPPRTAPPPDLHPARPEDAEAIRDVYRASVCGLAVSHYPPEVLAAWAQLDPARSLGARAKGGEALFVAVENGRVVGFSALRGEEVRAVFLHPDWAGRGLGRQLLAAVETEARGRGASELVVRSSLNAAPFFETQGYRDVRPVELPLPCGERLETLEMVKALAPCVH